MRRYWRATGRRIIENKHNELDKSAEMDGLSAQILQHDEKRAIEDRVECVGRTGDHGE